jgi:hypothetical protein
MADVSAATVGNALGRRVVRRMRPGWTIWTLEGRSRATGLGARVGGTRGVLVDVSVLGARIRCAPIDGTRQGDRVGIRLGRQRGVAVVRSISACPETGLVDVGVQFLRLDDRLRTAVYELVGGSGRRED